MPDLDVKAQLVISIRDATRNVISDGVGELWLENRNCMRDRELTYIMLHTRNHVEGVAGGLSIVGNNVIHTDGASNLSIWKKKKKRGRRKNMKSGGFGGEPHDYRCLKNKREKRT
jgi:hypothetical protein